MEPVVEELVDTAENIDDDITELIRGLLADDGERVYRATLKVAREWLHFKEVLNRIGS